MRRSYKFRIYPSRIQRERLDHTLNLLRDLYNAAIQERRDAWKMNRVRVTCFDQINQIAAIRQNDPDYAAMRVRPLEQCLRQADKAFQAFFRRVKARQNPGFPRFKGKTFFNSIIYNRDGYRFRRDKLNISVIGDLKIKLSRPIDGVIREVSLKREGPRWFAVISCDGIDPVTLPATGKVIGIDVGIESFATLSDGTQIDNWRYYESAQRKLRVAQRRVARRVKGSNRRRKAVVLLRQVHRKIVNQRHDFQHKLSTHLIRECDLIAVEKLNVIGLTKSRLSKQVNDAGWSSFKEKLTYKAESAGRKLVEVKPAYTSQDCSGCGTRVKKVLSVRVHSCSNCGLNLHRDHNAALNILRLGQSLQDVTYRATESVS